MRIISGLARGRKLKTPGNSNSIRPTTDRAREALFSIIGNRIISARVLDLFAGTGALGLEAFSRGAQQVVFVEKQSKAIEVIKHNCALCTMGLKDIQGNELTVIQYDLCRGLNFKHPTFDESSCFDLIFLDPPYKKNLAEKSLTFLDSSHFITATTLIIAEESSGQSLPDSYSRLELADQRRYGDTGFWFYKVKDQ
ncbi:MAG TPA: 16S rRNA (guanine(966)-N(2))-methyltransferase RsmD [Desulfocapsa sulfexigens]|nr:16S rRNA (guanine(966)-N(2))-methyltransferase RsmD [Desulfocapsa sulfexigens]